MARAENPGWNRLRCYRRSEPGVKRRARPQGRRLAPAALLGLTAVLSSMGAVLEADEPTSVEARLTHCLVSLIDDVRVPAQEAGVLIALEAREGLDVEAGTLLARINDSKAQYQRDIALAQQQMAQEKARNDVDVRYAEAAAKVAEYEYRVNEEANEKVPGARSLTELKRLLLAHHRAVLQIEQSQHMQKLAQMEAEGKSAEVAAAEDEIQRRQIRAPLGGQIVEVAPHLGEWVQPGDAVLRIVRLDRVRIEGFVQAADIAPAEISGRPVRVTARLERGRVEMFEGKIVFVHPFVQPGGSFRVWAEVVNRMEGGHWLLRPGSEVDMTIFSQARAAPPATGAGR